jgi:hypothetical protein
MEFKYVKNRDYYLPNIELSAENKNVNLGKYGRMREKFLKEQKHSLFDYLLMTEKLTSHLASIDKEASEYEEMLIKQIAERENVNENLKAKDQMEWVRRMNNIKNRAEEIVYNEIIYV